MNTGLDLALFILGGTIAIIALLADFSRSRAVKALPIPHRASRALLCLVGIIVASLPFLPSGAAPTPVSTSAAAVAPQPSPAATPNAATPVTANPTPSETQTPATPDVRQSQPNLTMNTTDQVVVKDAEGIQATPRNVTVRELPDSVVRELLKRHPVPIEPDFAKDGAAGKTEGSGN